MLLKKIDLKAEIRLCYQTNRYLFDLVFPDHNQTQASGSEVCLEFSNYNQILFSAISYEAEY